jgi:hypothetical protein
MPRFDWIERTPLWKVFWLYGVIPSNLLWAALLWTLRQPAPHVAATGTLLAVILIYTAWIVIAVWQTAFNVGDPRYGVLARALTVVWAINTVLLVFFLGLPLLQ